MTQPAGHTRPAEAATKAPAPRPGIRALIDNATADRLYGWAWNAAEPDQRLTVELRLADRAVASTTADLARPDLADNGIGDGCHAFEFPLRPEWIARRGELSAVIRCEDGAEVPVAVRVRRPDDAQVSTQLQRAVERLAAEQASLRREVTARPDVAPELRERLDHLELWVARLDARLGEAAAVAAPRTGTGGGGGIGGVDPWLAALVAVLSSASSAALAVAVARALG
jgi:hypothetical protein